MTTVHKMYLNTNFATAGTTWRHGGFPELSAIYGLILCCIISDNNPSRTVFETFPRLHSIGA